MAWASGSPMPMVWGHCPDALCSCIGDGQIGHADAIQHTNEPFFCICRSAWRIPQPSIQRGRFFKGWAHNALRASLGGRAEASISPPPGTAVGGVGHWSGTDVNWGATLRSRDPLGSIDN